MPRFTVSPVSARSLRKTGSATAAAVDRSDSSLTSAALASGDKRRPTGVELSQGDKGLKDPMRRRFSQTDTQGQISQRSLTTAAGQRFE